MRWHRNRNFGMTLLGAWLILTGLSPFLHLGFVNLGLISAVVAIAAGLLLLWGR